MTGVAGLTVKVNVAVPVPPALVALIVTLETADMVGVPEITPVLVLTVNGVGRLAALKLVGPLLAVML
jgi:hypothetical protein